MAEAYFIGMLRELRINGIVLMPALATTFSRGLTVLTGETGAGKSIVLDALGLVLGGRGDTGLIDSSSSAALIVAVFDHPRTPEVIRFLESNNLPQNAAPPDTHSNGAATTAGRTHPPAHSPARPASAPEKLVLRRLLGKDGRNKVLINERLASVQVLRGLGRLLVSVEGQFRQLGLLDPDEHGRWLDRYAESVELADRVALCFGTWVKAARTLKTFEHQVETGDPEKLRFDIAELANLDPQPDEDNQLQRQIARLKQTQELAHCLQLLHTIIDGGDGVRTQFGSLVQTTGRITTLIQEAVGETPPQPTDETGPADHEGEEGFFVAAQNVQTVAAAAERAMIEIDEASLALHGIQLEYDARLHTELDDRYHALRAAARRHKCTVSELPSERERMQLMLEGLTKITETRAKLKATLEVAQKQYSALAKELSAKRAQAIESLEARIATELPVLKMAQAAFHVESTKNEKPQANGLETMRFVARTNPGAAFSPIDKVASGGELSRFLLALNLALGKVVTTPTLIFDEIDSGVGGATAHAIGKRLRDLAAGRQVIVVTHSPQVAACGHHHVKVLKRMIEERNQTALLPLSASTDRVHEVARMLSGDEVTAEAEAAAERLLMA